MKTSDNLILLECPTVKLDLKKTLRVVHKSLFTYIHEKWPFWLFCGYEWVFDRIWLNSRTNLIIQVEISMNYQWIYHWYFHFAIFEFIQFHSIWFGSAKSDFKPEIAHNPAKNQSQFDWFRKLDLRMIFQEYHWIYQYRSDSTRWPLINKSARNLSQILPNWKFACQNLHITWK